MKRDARYRPLHSHARANGKGASKGNGNQSSIAMLNEAWKTGTMSSNSSDPESPLLDILTKLVCQKLMQALGIEEIVDP